MWNSKIERSRARKVDLRNLYGPRPRPLGSASLGIAQARKSKRLARADKRRSQAFPTYTVRPAIGALEVPERQAMIHMIGRAAIGLVSTAMLISSAVAAPLNCQNVEQSPELDHYHPKSRPEHVQRLK